MFGSFKVENIISNFTFLTQARAPLKNILTKRFQVL